MDIGRDPQSGRLVAGETVAVSLMMMVGLGWLLTQLASQPSALEAEQAPQPLVLLCAASNRPVIEVILADYRHKTGKTTLVQYGGSQVLLASLTIGQEADLFLPADDSYVAMARQRGLIDDVFPVAEMQAVVAVPRSNPLGISSPDDLLQDQVRLAVANPDTAAIGLLTKRAFEARGEWDRLADAVDVFPTTVTEVANAVAIGAVDAGIVYDVVLREYPDLEGIVIPQLRDARSRVSLAVARGTPQPEEALQLARYITAADGGLVRYGEYGFGAPHVR